MLIFGSFLVLFVPTVFFCYMVLRFFSLNFIYNQSGTYFHGSFYTSMGVVFILLLASVILAWFVTRPFEKIIKKIKSENYEPTDEEKENCLLIYKKLNYIIIAVDILGFFVGQTLVTILGILNGRHEFIPVMTALIILQSISFGIMGAAIVINGLDLQFSKFRAMLKLQSFEKIKKVRISNVSNSILYTFIAATSFISINMLTVVYGASTGESSIPVLVKGLICIVVSLFMSIEAFYFIIHGLRARMKDTSNALDQIALKGDLTQRIDITVLDDFGTLTTAINTMIDKLSTMLGQLSNKTEDVSKSADVISDSVVSASSALVQMTETLNKITNNSTNQNDLIHQADESILNLTNSVENVKKQIIEQTNAVDSISASITQMSANISSVTETAKKAQTTSEALSSTTELGKQAIQNAIISMKQIQKSSEEVKNLVNMIQSVARDTNLLSMNAAIEAAHAGEFGAGFAVVANEVRNLAESSAKSAKNVQNSINDMAQKIAVGVEAISSAGVSFENIAQQVDMNAQYVTNISEAMEEQNIGANETQQATVDVVNIAKAVNDLAMEEANDAEQVRELMKTVVSASESTMNAVTESYSASENLKSSIELVEQSGSENKTSVDVIKQQMNQFTI